MKLIFGFFPVLFVVVFSAFIFAACPAEVEEDSGPTIYTAGYYYKDSVSTACYWENEDRFDLALPSGAADSGAHSLAVSGGNIYIAGWYEEGGVKKACYWKDGIRVDFDLPSGATDAEAHSLTVSGANFFSAGYYDKGGVKKACFWKNGKEFDLDLPAGAVNGRASALAVSDSGDNICIAGNYEDGGDDTACYWKNTWRVSLDSGTGGGALAAAVSETLVLSGGAVTTVKPDYYIAGYYDKGGVKRACYWKNGTKTDLAGGDGGAANAIALMDENSGAANAVVPAGKNIYIAGHYESGGVKRACYWKNGEKIDLADGDNGVANAIAFFGGHVYFAGSCQNSGGSSAACYWKNGEKINLEAGSGESYAQALWVADENPASDEL